MRRRRYQFVWWWRPLSFYKPISGPWTYPPDGPHRGCIYRWMFRVGPLEIRRWAELGEGIFMAARPAGRRRGVRGMATTKETLVRRVAFSNPDGTAVMRTERVEVEIIWPDGVPDYRASGHWIEPGEWVLAEAPRA